MDSAAESHLFLRYWRSFLPIWLLPLPVLAVVLLADFASRDYVSRILPYTVVGMVVYFIIAAIWFIGPWRRGEITYFQSLVLFAPLGGVAVVCVLLRWILAQLLQQ
jgi:hypothetical protein